VNSLSYWTGLPALTSTSDLSHLSLYYTCKCFDPLNRLDPFSNFRIKYQPSYQIIFQFTVIHLWPSRRSSYFFSATIVTRIGTDNYHIISSLLNLKPFVSLSRPLPFLDPRCSIAPFPGENPLLVFQTSSILFVNPMTMNILKSACTNLEEIKYISTVRSRRVGSCSFFLRAADLVAPFPISPSAVP
jgi:hypothetical protein